MKSDYPKIFEPITIKRTTIKNRIAMTPMGTNYGETSGEMSNRHMNYYSLRAKGGVGLIILENANIEVRFNTEAKPGELSGFDKVIVAIGAEPIILPLPGVDGKNVMTGIDALLHPEQVKGKVAVIGGGEIGVEVGMFLAKKGHPSTVLEMRDMLAADATPIHYYNMVRDAWEATEGFSSILKAKVTGITDAGVTYTDENGESKIVEANTVILSVGTRSKRDEAYAFYAPGAETTVIGDALAVKTVQGAMRTGYAAGNNA